MARKNIVNLTGIVGSEPKLTRRDGKELMFFKLILTRPNHTGTDEPFIEVLDAESFPRVNKLEIGDAVHIEGEIRTREVRRTIVCEQCKQSHYVDLMLTTIVPKDERDKGIQQLPWKGQAFSQNHVYLIGVLVKDPSRWKTRGGVDKTKYQVAINRKDADGGADFPFVASYRRLATEDGMRLQHGSQLFVDGTIQTSTRPRQIDCPVCGAVHTLNGMNTEVIARSTEYLNRCKFPENADPNHWAMQNMLKVGNSAKGHQAI